MIVRRLWIWIWTWSWRERAPRWTAVAVLISSLALPGPAAAQTTSSATSSAAVAAALLDPCALVTQAEAQTLLDDPDLLPPTGNNNPNIGASCDYADTSGQHLVHVAVYPNASMQVLTEPAAPAYTGLGVEAYCDPHTIAGGDVADLHAAVDATDVLQVAELQGFLTCATAAGFAQLALQRLSSAAPDTSGSVVQSP